MRDIGMFEKRPQRPRSVLDNSYMVSSIDGGLVCVFQNGTRYNVFVETISEAAPIIKHLSLIKGYSDSFDGNKLVLEKHPQPSSCALT